MIGMVVVALAIAIVSHNTGDTQDDSPAIIAISSHITNDTQDDSLPASSTLSIEEEVTENQVHFVEDFAIKGFSKQSTWENYNSISKTVVANGGLETFKITFNLYSDSVSVDAQLLASSQNYVFLYAAVRIRSLSDGRLMHHKSMSLRLELNKSQTKLAVLQYRPIEILDGDIFTLKLSGSYAVNSQYKTYKLVHVSPLNHVAHRHANVNITYSWIVCNYT